MKTSKIQKQKSPTKDKSYKINNVTYKAMTKTKKTKKKKDNELVISSKGRVSFPSSVVYKHGKKIYCTPLMDASERECLFMFGPKKALPLKNGSFEVKNGTIEIFSILGKMGLLPQEGTITRKFVIHEESPNSEVFNMFFRIREDEQWMAEKGISSYSKHTAKAEIEARMEAE